MNRPDTPRLQVLTPEVAKVERDDDRRLTIDRRGQHMTVLFVVDHPGGERLVPADPRLAKMGVQFSFKMSRQRIRPSELRFQCPGRLANDLL